MNHTPGPWLLKDGWESPFRNCLVKAVFTKGKNPRYIADVLSGDLGDADARLIAIAPELYEALKVLLESARCKNRCKRFDMTCASRRAEAVLRKA
jgi:hypothetical protein